MVLDAQLRILTQLQIQDDASIIEQQQFTEAEWYLFREVLAAYPYYCPFANLLSAQTSWSLERSQKAVNRAIDEGDIDALMRPVRNTLSRVRIKLRFFGLDARSVIETGYMLMPERSKRSGRPEVQFE